VSVNVKFSATGRVASLPWSHVQLTEPKAVVTPLKLNIPAPVVTTPAPRRPTQSNSPRDAPQQQQQQQPPPLKHAASWSAVRPTAAERAPAPASQAAPPQPISPRGHAGTFSRPPAPDLVAPTLPPALSATPPPEKKRGLTLMGGMRSPRSATVAQPTPAPRNVEIGAPIIVADGSPRKMSSPQPITRNQCPQCMSSFALKEDLVRHLDHDCRKGSLRGAGSSPVSVPEPAVAPAIEIPKPVTRNASIPARQAPNMNASSLGHSAGFVAPAPSPAVVVAPLSPVHEKKVCCFCFYS
jgi:hypothetical protein